MNDDDIDLHAARWHAAMDGDAMDWDGFTAWLEADPRHRAAYDGIALLDDAIVQDRDEIAALLPSPTPAPAPAPRWKRWAAGGGAIAAGVALMLAWPHPAPDRQWQTAARIGTIALADGTRVTMAPHSRLTARGGRTADLALAGAAYFDVPHRAGRTLTIEAGGYRVSDIGTRFTVNADRAAFRIAVAEGSLAVTAPTLAAPVALAAGHGLVARDGMVEAIAVDPAAVASWRTGLLVYRDTPLALVAADIGRYAGAVVTVDPRLADRRFSGALTIGDGTTLARTVAAIMAVDLHRDGAGLRLRPRP